MDVILIQPRHRISRAPNRVTRHAPLPAGLLSVATPLDVAGYKVRVIDQWTEPDWEETLLTELKTKPICVGVTAMTGGQLWGALKASEIVKRNSDVTVVWGGVHSSLLPRQTLENPYIDIVVQGEGEETFFDLVRALGNRQPLDKVKGIWYKDSGQIRQNPPRSFIDLNQQPPLSYHLIDLKSHMASTYGIDALPIETSRGCPFDCSFCYNTSFNRRHWRAMDTEQTLFRIKRVVEQYGIRGFVFADDNFFTNLNRAHDILEGIVKQKLNIIWGKGDIRLDQLAQLDDEFLELIERSGCHSLAIGIESGSQRIADAMRKGIDVSQAIPVNRKLAKYRIMMSYLFLLGIPGETEADLAKSASLMLKLLDDNPKARNGVQVFVPYPGTELFDLSVQHGLQMPRKLEDWATYGWINRKVEYPWLSAEMKGLIRMLSFCGAFMPSDKRMKQFSADVSPVISLIAKLYYPVARVRVKGLHYKFMPEIKVAELLGYSGL
jgi:anaerobic magnesium-protoporphyrin IX monomethyl ester cyclase